MGPKFAGAELDVDSARVAFLSKLFDRIVATMGGKHNTAKQTR